jgi:hypothetical protein
MILKFVLKAADASKKIVWKAAHDIYTGENSPVKEKES